MSFVLSVDERARLKCHVKTLPCGHVPCVCLCVCEPSRPVSTARPQLSSPPCRAAAIHLLSPSGQATNLSERPPAMKDLPPPFPFFLPPSLVSLLTHTPHLSSQFSLHIRFCLSSQCPLCNLFLLYFSFASSIRSLSVCQPLICCSPSPLTF